MICVHPKKRATLEEIKQHRWVNEGYTSPPKSYLPPRQALTSENIDDELVEKVINFGYSEEDIIEKLTSVEANAARETYYLLKEMYEREEKLTNGDKVSFFFFYFSWCWFPHVLCVRRRNHRSQYRWHSRARRPSRRQQHWTQLPRTVSRQSTATPPQAVLSAVAPAVATSTRRLSTTLSDRPRHARAVCHPPAR